MKEQSTVTWCPYCYAIQSRELRVCPECKTPLVTTDDNPEGLKVSDGFCENPCFFLGSLFEDCEESRKFSTPIRPVMPWGSGGSFIENLFEALRPDEEVEKLRCYKSMAFVPQIHPDRFHYHILIKKLKAKRDLSGNALNNKLLELDGMLLDHWEACGWWPVNYDMLEDVNATNMEATVKREIILIKETETQVKKNLTDSGFRYLKGKAMHRCTEINRAAIRAITNCGGEKASEVLGELFNTSNLHLRMEALLAFGQLSTEHSMGHLVEALHDQNEEIVETAINILSNKRKQGMPAVRELVNLANSKHPKRLAAVYALSTITGNLRYKILYKLLSLQKKKNNTR